MSNNGHRFSQIHMEFNTQFNELLRIDIKHDFFSDGVANCFKIRATEGTTRLLKEHQLLYRVTDQGISFGYGGTDTYVPLKAIDKPLQLSFFVDVSDAGFLNYTELPYEFEEEKVFYFNNKSLEKDSTETKNLSIDEFVTAEDKIEICGSVIQYTFDEPQFDVEVQVVNANEEVVFEATVEDGLSFCDLNLLGQVPGRYTILVDGIEEKSFFLYTGLKKLFGAIDIFIDKEDFGDYAFFDDAGELVEQQYTIHFPVRKLRWRYLLFDSSTGIENTEHEIIDMAKGKKQPPILFSKAKKMEDGAIEIWTEEPIPFEQIQSQRFKLKMKKGKAKVDWMLDLPSASFKDDLKVVFLNHSEIYSEIIVYL